MEKDLAMLQWIHKNAEMGCMTIPQVMDLTRDTKFRQVLENQFREYDAISKESAALVKKRGAEPKEPDPFVVAMSDMMLQMRGRGKHSESKLSAMMIKGSTNGTIQITRRLDDCKGADDSLRALGKRLLKTEEQNIQELKRFL